VYLALGAPLLYIQSIRFGYLQLDDKLVAVRNPLNMFLEDGTFNYGRFYWPVRDLSYLIDHFLFKKSALMAHLHNLVLVYACAIAAGLFFRKVYRRSSWHLLALLVFFIHPTHP